MSKNVIAPEEALVLDGEGKTMIPGLSDAHMHLSETFGDGQLRNDAHWMYTALRTANAVENFLMLCFTTVRDLVGPVFGLKRAVDEGVVHEPRIYLSGTYINQTSGHGNMQSTNEPSVHLSRGQMHPADLLGWSFVVAGVPKVLKAARENLRKGATQLKVVAGGGMLQALTLFIQFSSLLQNLRPLCKQLLIGIPILLYIFMNQKEPYAPWKQV